MPLITSATLIRTLSVLHLTTAYYLLTQPSFLTSQNIVLVLGASMKLPVPAASLSTPTTATALAALFLTALAVNDLLAATLTQFVYDEYWSAQAPLRCLLWGILAVWVYVTGRDASSVMGRMEDVVGGKGAGGDLKNSFVFAIGFVEMSIMFWFYLTLKDERNQTAMKMAEKQQRENDLM